MKWLLTTSANVDLAALRDQLGLAGATLEDEHEPIPMGAGEQVVQADGPVDLPVRLREVTTSIKEIHPSSEMELY